MLVVVDVCCLMLEVGNWMLLIVFVWLLVFGCWFLVGGVWLLIDGCLMFSLLIVGVVCFCVLLCDVDVGVGCCGGCCWRCSVLLCVVVGRLLLWFSFVFCC